MSDPKNPIRGDEGKEQPIPAETMGFEPHPFDDAETHVLPDDATMPLAKKSPVAPADSGPTQILPGAKLSAAQQEELLETRVVAETAVPKPVTLPKKPAPAPLPEDDVTIPAPQAYKNQSTRMHATEEAELTRPLMADSEQPTVHAPIQDLNSFAPEYNPDDDATVEYEKNEATARGEVIDALAATLPVVEQTKGRPSTDATKRTNFGAPTENPTRRSSEANRVTNQAARQTKNVPPLQEVPEKHRHYMKLLGKTLDGYFIESLLGAGGMGAVYLAHQVSLDRKVAFKILPEKFAGNPQLLARFTREALSAAQLSHHNIMGVIDIGFAEGIHYISLEFVRGKNIGDITREKGKLPFDEAAGYILQAARGLAYAHDRGMVHRDIKPDNLMLNEHGVIKVADMGLAKMHQWEERPMGMQHYGDDIRLKAMSTDLTQAEVAMGTPAYMSPEQARDTATVDGRSDQYSLGCTFYYLCSGKAPYSGTTAFELMTKHIKEPLIPLSTHVGDVPISIKTIVEKMLHKNPDDRYPNMHEVARQLELYLGVDSSGDFKPREHHLGILERVALEFHNAKGRALRDTVQLGMLILPPLILVICLLSQSLFAIGFGLALGTLVPALAFLTIGFLTRAPLFLRVRRLLFSLGWKTWLQAIVGTGLTVLMLWLVGWLWMWIAMGLLGVAGGFAYWKFLHQPLAKERERILDPLQEVLKELRLRGLSEDKVQFFIMQFAGDSWEELFEALYDYDTKRAARQVREDAKLPKAKKYGVWRDVLINWVEEREAAWRKAREAKVLQRVEVARLKSEGMTEAQAQTQAKTEVEQILQEVATKRAEEQETFEKRRRINPLRFIPFTPILKLVQFALAVLLMMLPLLQIRPIGNLVPGDFNGLLISLYEASSMKFAESELVPETFDKVATGSAVSSPLSFVAGFVLLLLLFSRGTFFLILSVIGGGAFLFSRTLIDAAEQQPYAMTLLLYSSLGMIAFSFLCRLLLRLTGGKY